jgi:hypothetical protein
LIWAIFGLAAAFVILGLIGSMGDMGTASAGPTFAEYVFMTAYPLAVILLAAGLLYLVITRTRK